jgi:hypothetical protein
MKWEARITQRFQSGNSDGHFISLSFHMGLQHQITIPIVAFMQYPIIHSISDLLSWNRPNVLFAQSPFSRKLAVIASPVSGMTDCYKFEKGPLK